MAERNTHASHSLPPLPRCKHTLKSERYFLPLADLVGYNRALYEHSSVSKTLQIVGLVKHTGTEPGWKAKPGSEY